MNNFRSHNIFEFLNTSSSDVLEFPSHKYRGSNGELNNNNNKTIKSQFDFYCDCRIIKLNKFQLNSIHTLQLYEDESIRSTDDGVMFMLLLFLNKKFNNHTSGGATK